MWLLIGVQGAKQLYGANISMFDLFSNRNGDFPLWEPELSIGGNIGFNEKTLKEIKKLGSSKTSILSKQISSSILLTLLSFLQRWNALEQRYNYSPFHKYSALWMIVGESAVKVDVPAAGGLTSRSGQNSQTG